MRRLLALSLSLGMLVTPAAWASRTFTDGTWLQLNAALVTAVPLTMCAWIRPSAVNVSQHFMGVGGSGSDDHRFNLLLESDATLRMITRDTTNHLTTLASPTVTVSAWSLACGVWRTSTSRTLFLNGSANQVTTTDSKTPTAGSINRTWYGHGTDASANLDLNGQMAFPMIWNVALVDAEIDALARGTHPRAVRPLSLLSCPHIFGDLSPEFDECGARNWPLDGAPAKAATRPPVAPFSLSFGR